MRFIWTPDGCLSPGSSSIVGQIILNTIDLYNRGDGLNGNIELLKLQLLVEDLRRIEAHSDKLLRYFSAQLHKTKYYQSYFGLRMEIRTAASLIEKGIIFFKAESPDFTVSDRNVYIECGSIHVTSAHVRLETQIAKPLKGKSVKGYCTPSTALFIDCTNLLFRAPNTSDQDVRAEVGTVLSSTDFGSTLLFDYHVTADGRLHHSYYRIDNSVIDNNLLQFLTEYYPLGSYSTGPGWQIASG
jgi:hypothetical protein